MKIYALGTSITAGSGGYITYPELLAREFGTTVVNLGTSGGTIGITKHGESKYNGIIYNAANNIGSDADIVLVEPIMNDFRMCTSLGSFSDTTQSTFYGALNLLVKRIKSKAPSAQIFFLNSHENADTSSQNGHLTGNYKTPNHLGHTLYDYQVALESVAEYNHQARIIDTCTLTGIKGAIEEGLNPVHTYDKIHLTNEGARAYAQVISNEIRYRLYTPKKLLRKVIYVPIDDRPCNYDRITLAGESMGLEIITPVKSVVSTKLDGQTTGNNIGNRDYLMSWLSSIEIDHGDEIDAYLLSMDMLYSGGLVGSRDLQLADIEYADKIVSFINSTSKPIYIMDTVMRLASTAGFNGYEMNEYNNTRNYGKKKRKTASPNSVKSVIDCMKIDEYGNTISHSGLSTSQVNKYIASRTRKINFTSKLIQAVKNKNNVYVLYGVDDSSNQSNVQSNEIKYIQDTLPSHMGMIMSGTDELAMVLLSRIAIDQFAQWTNIKTAPKVKITYFGGGENSLADEFEYCSVKENVNLHLQSTKCNVVASGENLETLILTPGSTISHVQQLVNKMNSNLAAGKLTAVIDVSTNKSELQKQLLSLIDSGNKNLPILMAYSSWNTTGNAIGLCLGHAIGRVCFMGLDDRGTITTMAARGQAELLFLEYAKDMCYQIGARPYALRQLFAEIGIQQGTAEADNISTNFIKYSSKYNLGLVKIYEKHIKEYLKITTTSSANFNMNRLIKAFENATMYSYYLTTSAYGVKTINKPVSVLSNANHVVLPWGRHFEALLDTYITIR